MRNIAFYTLFNVNYFKDKPLVYEKRFIQQAPKWPGHFVERCTGFFVKSSRDFPV
jgi:hypothetical protein